MQYLAADKIEPTAGPDDSLKLGAAVFPPLDSRQGPYVQLDSRGYQTLLDYRDGADPFRRTTVSAIMDQDLSALVKGKAIIIGGVAQTVKDSYSTPFTSMFGNGGTAYGMEIHAEVADQIIREALGQSKPVKGLPRGIEGLWILGWAIAGATLGLLIRAALPGLAVGTFGLFAIAAIVVIAFRHGLLLPGVPAALSWAGAAALTNQVLYAASNRARARLRAAFERYLPPALVKQMAEADAMPELRGERREISVLFTDVAGFTSFSEGRDPVELAQLTNDYFERICAAVFAHGGLVNAFIGDSVLAFFGAPIEQPDHADRAIDAAIDIDRAARIFVDEQLERGVKFGITRVGVHTGPAFVGNVGSRDRLQYTALGDTLNCGSRLEGVNKVIGTRICASGDILGKAERHQWRPVGSVVVAGRDQPIEVFTPLEGEQGTWEDQYQAAFEAAAARRPEAASLFAALYRDHPDDACVSFHHRRLSDGALGTLIVMDKK
jgi:class 3 adenylate cyclase